jgi:hypothetical protein
MAIDKAEKRKIKAIAVIILSLFGLALLLITVSGR